MNQTAKKGFYVGAAAAVVTGASWLALSVGKTIAPNDEIAAKEVIHAAPVTTTPSADQPAVASAQAATAPASLEATAQLVALPSVVMPAPAPAVAVTPDSQGAAVQLTVEPVPQTTKPATFSPSEVQGTRRMYAAHAPLRTKQVSDPDSEANRQILEAMVNKALARSNSSK